MRSPKNPVSRMNGRKNIRLGFAGDLMLGGEAVRHALDRGLELTYPFKALLPTLASLDVLFVNLEGPLFGKQAAAMRKPLLLSNHPAVVEVLKLPKVCVCNLANNHSLDFGPEALVRTQRYLDKHGIRHIGAGRNAAEAGRDVVLEQMGWRIGCLAFTGSGDGLRPVVARNGQAGCASLQDRSTAVGLVRRLRKRVDLVINMLHWGLEFHEYPSAAQVRLAHALVDAGAHVIAGHHPHALQAVETYNGALIAYSLGHLYMPPFRLANHGPVFCPRPASREFVLLRVELPGEFPRSTGCVNVVSGAVDEHFRLRPYDRIALQTFRTRLDNLGCPLRNGGYGKFWQVYRAWRRRELEAWRSWPAIEELQPANPRVLIFPNRLS